MFGPVSLQVIPLNQSKRKQTRYGLAFGPHTPNGGSWLFYSLHPVKFIFEHQKFRPIQTLNLKQAFKKYKHFNSLLGWKIKFTIMNRVQGFHPLKQAIVFGQKVLNQSLVAI